MEGGISQKLYPKIQGRLVGSLNQIDSTSSIKSKALKPKALLSQMSNDLSFLTRKLGKEPFEIFFTFESSLVC